MPALFPRFIFSGFLSAILLIGGPSYGQSLREALVNTHQSNPTIAAAQAQTLQANQTYRQQLAQTRLSVTANISGQGVSTNEVSSANPLGETQNVNLGSIGITATQRLLQGGFDGIPAGVRVALGNVVLANANYKSQEAGVFIQTVNAYMGVLQEQASLGVTHSGVHNARREVETARVRQEAGDGTQADVALAEASLAQAEANLAVVRANLEAAKATFRQIVGRHPASLRDPGFPALPQNLGDALTKGMDGHPSIEAAEVNLEIAHDTVITTRAQYGMSVNATASVSQDWSDASGDWDNNETASLGIQFSIPLFDGGQRRAAVRSAEQGVVAAEANLNGQKAAVRAQIQSAWANSQAQIAQLNSLIALTSARQAVLRATEAEFDAGTATVLQVLTAQQNYADAQSQYVRAKAGAVISAYNLLSAMGQMTSERLALPVQHFNSLDQL